MKATTSLWVTGRYRRRPYLSDLGGWDKDLTDSQKPSHDITICMMIHQISVSLYRDPSSPIWICLLNIYITRVTDVVLTENRFTKITSLTSVFILRCHG